MTAVLYQLELNYMELFVIIQTLHGMAAIVIFLAS